MKILINATSARLGGGITVIRNLLPALVSEDGGRNEYVVIGRNDVRDQLDTGAERIEFVTSNVGGDSTLSRVFREQLDLPLRTLFTSADLVLSPANLAVFASPRPQVLMFQNLAPFDRDVIQRSAVSRRGRFKLLRRLGIVSARLAKRVVFISDFARDFILPQLGIDTTKVRRIYMGRDLRFNPGARAGSDAIVARLGIRRPYVLSVSQFYFYKNFVELVIGFARARRAISASVELVIAGEEYDRDYAELVRRTAAREGVTDCVRLVGQVPYTDLPALYAGAELFVFPSACESFPNILIEGMASGTPTISSNRASMPELAGDGAYYFDPFEPDEIAAQIVRLWHDGRAREDLRSRGLARCERYTWEQTARETLRLFEELV
jgi:glycosyltransferase involved in cell wall biosynthesis